MQHQCLEPGAEVVRKLGKSERGSRIVGAYIGGDHEHAGDAEPDLRFLLGRQRLTQGCVGELLCLLAEARGEKGDRPPRYERAASRIVGSRQLKCTRSEIG